MTIIDPRVVGGFVRHIASAREAGAHALDALAPMVAGASANADDVSAAARELDTVARTLDASLHQNTTHAAAEAVAELNTVELPGIARSLDDLRVSIETAGANADPAQVATRAGDVQTRLRRVVEYQLGEIADKATRPLPGEDATLGAATATGAWQPREDALAATVNDIAADSGLTLDHSELFSEVNAALRTAEDHLLAGGRAGGAFDSEIKASEWMQVVDTPADIDTYFGKKMNTIARLHARAADLRRTTPLDAHTGGVVPRYRDGAPSGPRAVVTGIDDAMGTPRIGDRVATLQFQRPRESAVELPLVLSREPVPVPTREQAIELASSAGGEWYLVAPHADGGWQVLPVRDVGSNVDRALNLHRYEHVGISGIRQDAGRIDAVVHNGDVVHGTTPSADVDAAAAQAAAFEGLVPHVSRADFGDVPFGVRNGTPFANVTVRGSKHVAPWTDTLVARSYVGVTMVDGDRDGALKHLSSVARGGNSFQMNALVRVDVGRFAIVPIDGLKSMSAHAREQLRSSLSADSITGQFAADVEAIAVGRGKSARILDVRSGEVS